MQQLVRDLNRIYRDTPALWAQDDDPAGFRWIDANDAAGNVFSFLRYGATGRSLACVANFSAVPHEGYRLGLPHGRPLGRGDQHRRRGLRRLRVGNFGGVDAGEPSWHGQPASAEMRVPPLGTIWLRYIGMTRSRSIQLADWRTFSDNVDQSRST